MKTSAAVVVVLLELASHNPIAMAQSLGTFTATGNLTRPRQFHTATLLTNGKVLIAGGFGINGWAVQASAELYDPATGIFTATGEMTVGRYSHTATLLPDGKVLITGGNNSIAGGCFCNLLPTAELYDPSTGAFAATGEMTTAKSAHTATLLNSGKVLVAGGATNRSSAAAELYDPSTGAFTATNDMTVPRWGHKATLLANGKVLMDGSAGGRPGSEIYDPDTGTFSLSGTSTTALGVDPSELMPATASLLMNGKVLITLTPGGEPGDLTEVYDPLSGVFSTTGRMNNGRGYSTSTLLPDGKVLIAGRDWISHPNGSAELYDPATGTFSITRDLITQSEEGHTATLLPNGTVLISGGWTCCGETIASAEIYRPAVPTPAPTLLSLSGDGRGQGAILRAGTAEIVSADHPAAVDEVLEIYCTGLADGSVIPPHVTIGGRMAEILWFGKAPGFNGLSQVNIRVPGGVRSGPAVPVLLTYLARPSNEVTIGVR